MNNTSVCICPETGSVGTNIRAYLGARCAWRLEYRNSPKKPHTVESLKSEAESPFSHAVVRFRKMSLLNHKIYQGAMLMMSMFLSSLSLLSKTLSIFVALFALRLSANPNAWQDWMLGLCTSNPARAFQPHWEICPYAVFLLLRTSSESASSLVEMGKSQNSRSSS